MIAPPLDRAELLARLQAAAPKIDDDERLLVLVWQAEREAEGKLDAEPFRSHTHSGLPRGYEVRDLTGAAVVASVNAITAVLSLLGRRPAVRGMPVSL